LPLVPDFSDTRTSIFPTRELRILEVKIDEVKDIMGRKDKVGKLVICLFDLVLVFHSTICFQ
jgi:hypothetical protein